jgi:FMN-dependent NADH-azoreductase
MINILHVIASPRNEKSISTSIASNYIDGCRKKYPGCTIKTIDVWKDALPEFDEHALNAKYAGLQAIALTAQQVEAWNIIRKIAADFHQADLILFSVPMWNFGIPYKLKQLIDLISHKDILFTFDENGFNGKLMNKKAVLIAARGVNFATGTATPEAEYDFQNSYMLMWLKFIGISDVTIIKAEQTLFGKEAEIEAVKKAFEAAETAVAALNKGMHIELLPYGIK